MMWLKKPEAPAQFRAATTEEAPTAAKKAARRGRAVQTPVLNICQNLFVKRCSHNSSVMHGCELHTPSLPMPSANAATMHAHWERWSGMTLSGSGTVLDKSKVIQAEIEGSAKWPCLVWVKDNLMVNDCIIGIETRYREALRNAPGAPAVYQELTEMWLNCTNHSACLPLRSLIDGDKND